GLQRPCPRRRREPEGGLSGAGRGGSTICCGIASSTWLEPAAAQRGDDAAEVLRPGGPSRRRCCAPQVWMSRSATPLRFSAAIKAFIRALLALIASPPCAWVTTPALRVARSGLRAEAVTLSSTPSGDKVTVGGGLGEREART